MNRAYSDDPRAHQLRALALREELRGERSVNEICTLIAGCLLPVLAVTFAFQGFTASYLANFLSYLLFVGYTGGMYLLLRRGLHHPGIKYATVALLVTLVSATIAGYAPTSGWVHATRTATLTLYFVPLVISGLYLHPRVALFAGALAAAQYTGLFLYAALGAGAPIAEMETFDTAALSWDVLAVIAPGLLIAAGTVAALTRRSRFALLQAVFSEASRTELERVRQRLETMAWHDVLTGLNNRRRFQETFAAEQARARRYPGDLCLLMLDIDNFKQLNDEHGHTTGDRVLVQLSREVSRIIRETDHFARWGGEEFTILCPGTDIDGARLMAEKIRQHVESIELPGLRLGLSVSIGVTDLAPEDELDQLIERADSALYAAKRAGRNRVGVRPHRVPPPSEPLRLAN